MENNNNVQQDDLSAAFDAFQQGRTATGEPASAQTGNEPAKEPAPAQAQDQGQAGQTQDQGQSDNKDNNPTNQSFAKMRVENTNLNKKLNDLGTVLKTMGYESVDDFIAKKAEEELQQSATKNNVPVDFEKRIRMLEEENKRYREAQATQRINQEVGNLVQKYNVDKPTFDGFIGWLTANNINPLTSSMPLETFFIQYNPDAVFQARLADEKKKWEAEFTKGNNAPIVTPQGQPAAQQSNTPVKVDWKALAGKYKK